MTTDTIDEKVKVYDILKDFSTAMLVTHGAGGKHGARPMHVASTDENTGEIWFFTQRGGGLVDDIHREAAVLLVFQDEKSAYLSVRGQAHVEHNKARVKELWKEPYKVWFPQGPEDPDIALVGVQLVEAEFWDNRGMNGLRYMFEAAKAYVKGEKPEVVEADQHGKTSL